MKINIFLFIFLLIVSGCLNKVILKDVDNSKQKLTDKIVIQQIDLGWSDSDTYTVKVISDNLEKAKERAKHQILQDIVKVRMINESRFTDITKINAEFDKPLKNGTVISERKFDNGIEIYFRIKDQDLKQKFEKK